MSNSIPTSKPSTTDDQTLVSEPKIWDIPVAGETMYDTFSHAVTESKSENFEDDKENLCTSANEGKCL